MTRSNEQGTATVHHVSSKKEIRSSSVTLATGDDSHLEEVGFLTAMVLTLMGNYAQTGHFGGPLAYTPFTVASHLAGPDSGGLRFDYRRPKHPYADKFMLAGGHNAPVTYALWMIMGEALDRMHTKTGDAKYATDPEQSILSIDALGFRRGKDALANLLRDNDLESHPLMQQAKNRGIRALSGHYENTDLTKDVKSHRVTFAPSKPTSPVRTHRIEYLHNLVFRKPNFKYRASQIRS